MSFQVKLIFGNPSLHFEELLLYHGTDLIHRGTFLKHLKIGTHFLKNKNHFIPPFLEYSNYIKLDISHSVKKTSHYGQQVMSVLRKVPQISVVKVFMLPTQIAGSQC